MTGNPRLLLPLSLLLCSCGQGDAGAQSSSTPQPAQQAVAPPAPTPNYVEEENGTYFYVSGVSEEEAKRGKAAGDVLGYRYLGKNEKGQYKLARVNNSGQTEETMVCSDPCKIIRYSSGDRVAFTPNSVIGSAFQDAMNGLLKSEKKGADPTLVYPATVSSVPKKFRGAWDELTQDGCEGREARFAISDTKFYNFEVEWDVTKVTLLSDNEIDIHTTTKDDNGSQVNEVWQFKLADGGKALTSRKPGGEYFRRCP